MKVKTRKFGEIEIDENKVLFMPEGLPGFQGYERFALLEDPESAPFCWFQSIEEPNLALIVMNPLVFKPDYQINLKSFIASRDWNEKAEDLLIYSVINISGKGDNKKITANLIGPIIINPKQKEAVQVVIHDSTYSHQHNILESA